MSSVGSGSMPLVTGHVMRVSAIKAQPARLTGHQNHGSLCSKCLSVALMQTGMQAGVPAAWLRWQWRV